MDRRKALTTGVPHPPLSPVRYTAPKLLLRGSGAVYYTGRQRLYLRLDRLTDTVDDIVDIIV